MKSVPELVGELKATLADELRESLAQRDKSWLIDEVIRLTLRDVTLSQITHIDQQLQLERQEQRYLESTAEERGARVARVEALRLDDRKLQLVLEPMNHWDRAQLERERYLLDPPAKGGALIVRSQRSDAGQRLLQDAKDVLYALLFGGPEMNVRLERVERELLSMTLPRNKRFALDFMMAVSEIDVKGSWRDPGGGASDERAANVVMEVEYGEVASEAVGAAIATCLRLINDLEVNEVILYNRMSNVESSSL